MVALLAARLAVVVILAFQKLAPAVYLAVAARLKNLVAVATQLALELAQRLESLAVEAVAAVLVRTEPHQRQRQLQRVRHHEVRDSARRSQQGLVHSVPVARLAPL